MPDFADDLQRFIDHFTKREGGGDPFDENFIQFAALHWSDPVKRGKIRSILSRLSMPNDVRSDFYDSVIAAIDRSVVNSSPNPLDCVLSHPALIGLDIPITRIIGGFIAERSITMVFAARGRGKTRFSLGLACAVASGSEFLSWEAPPKPSGVLYVDGEMPLLGLQDIAKKLHRSGLDNLHFLPSEYFFAKTEGELRLTKEEGRLFVDQIIENLPDIKLLVLDNISCLFPGIREDKKEDWEAVAAWLIRLRHRGIATLLVHHSGKGGDQRGTSGREDALDNVIKLSAPPRYSPEDGCHFHLSFEKGRFLIGDAVKSIDVRCIDDGDTIYFEHTPLENDYMTQVRELMMDGLTSVSDIATELGISKGYASKLKRKVESDG